MHKFAIFYITLLTILKKLQDCILSDAEIVRLALWYEEKLIKINQKKNYKNSKNCLSKGKTVI